MPAKKRDRPRKKTRKPTPNFARLGAVSAEQAVLSLAASAIRKGFVKTGAKILAKSDAPMLVAESLFAIGIEANSLRNGQINTRQFAYKSIRHAAIGGASIAAVYACVSFGVPFACGPTSFAIKKAFS